MSLGVENFHYITEEEIRCTCPIHGGDNNTSFVAYPQSGTFVCFSHNCHKIKSNKLKDLASLCKQKPDISKINPEKRVSFKDLKKQKITKFDIKKLKAYEDYQILRGIPKDPVFAYVDVDNFYYMKDRAVFILWDYEHDKIVGISGRALSGDMSPTWKHVLQKDESHCVYFPHTISYRGKTTCILSEGIIDAIKLEIATKLPSIGILNSAITYNKARKLIEIFDNFIIIPDHDFKDDSTNPGLKGAQKTIEILKEFGKTATIKRLVPDSYEKSVDPGDFDIPKLKFLLKDLNAN